MMNTKRECERENEQIANEVDRLNLSTKWRWQGGEMVSRWTRTTRTGRLKKRAFANWSPAIRVYSRLKKMINRFLELNEMKKEENGQAPDDVKMNVKGDDMTKVNWNRKQTCNDQQDMKETRKRDNDDDDVADDEDGDGDVRQTSVKIRIKRKFSAKTKCVPQFPGMKAKTMTVVDQKATNHSKTRKNFFLWFSVYFKTRHGRFVKFEYELIRSSASALLDSVSSSS